MQPLQRKPFELNEIIKNLSIDLEKFKKGKKNYF